MNPWMGALLAVLAIAVGYAGYGWQGVVLGVTVVVFWMLLQFSRTLRVMQRAGRAPKGSVDSAVRVHAKLRPGMTLLEVLGVTGSLGERQSPVEGGEDATGAGTKEEWWRWQDAGQVALVLHLRRGRLVDWQLVRP
jgi:hypothetical protein